MSDEIKGIYEAKAGQYKALAEQKKKQLLILSAARFVCFLSVIPVFYFLYPANNALAIITFFLLLTVFLFLVKKFIYTEKELRFFLNLEAINRDELAALSRNYSAFNSGADFIDSHHDFSFDLDLYGEGSLFQFLNRTATENGRKKLSKVLNQTLRNSGEIVRLQEAIEELAAELDWRQHFLAKGKETESGKELTGVQPMPPIELKPAAKLEVILVVLPALACALLILSIFGFIGSSLVAIAVLVNWGFIFSFRKTVETFRKQFENQSKILERHAEMLRHIEDKKFRSPKLIELQQRLQHENETAGAIIRKLQKILHEFEYRQNMLVGFVLNSLLLWDIRCIYRLFKWQQNYAENLPAWFDVIAETDALVSLANCNYNHQEWVMPKVQESGFELNAQKLGHPLIERKKCVTNDFRISEKEKMVIVTGANMAGKSTFLRTVGVNFILASVGCKVFAETFRFSPVRVFTNMRTTDNLMNDESYFYAELLRLQTILELLRKGEKLFVILDEMLKGTNSIDKLNGSKELIKQLISLDTHGLVATHDLGLTELSGIYPDELKNQCFEVQLREDELTFNYKLTDGVTQTMNATFLMKKMGIIPESKSETTQAR